LDLTLETAAIIAATFLVAGMVKGVVGLGLPTVSLGVLTAVIGLPEAMALMLVPSFVTNLWQALVGGALWRLLRRLGLLLAVTTAAIWGGVVLLKELDAAASAALGVLLCLYSGISLATPQAPPPGRHEGWLSPLVGLVNGLLTGLTGSFVVPGVLYLQALGLPRDALVQAMGILFTVSTLALGVALAGNRLLPAEFGLLSAAALAPALLGMLAGQRIRRRLSEARFRKALFVALFGLGLYIVYRSLLA